MKSGLLVVLLVCCIGVEASWWNVFNPQCWSLFKTVVTYPPYGSFDDREPYDNANCKVPEPPEEMGLELFLNTKANPYYSTYLSYRDTYARDYITYSQFDAGKPTIFIIHGFTDSCFADWVWEMTDELTANFDVNVIRVNWERGADRRYSQSAANTRIVAAMLAHYIKILHSMGASYDSIHLIGHSLGAHISGQCGMRIKEMTGQKIGRITGMDPAGPLFDRDSREVRLDSTDADFVVSMHTDAEHLSKLGLGMLRVMGHVDFYPHGGHDQTNCPGTWFEVVGELLKNFQISAVRDGAACSHSRAHKFFTQSIKKCAYRADRCSSYSKFDANDCELDCNGAVCHNNMGYHATKAISGKFYLEVSGTDPYCCKYL